MALVFGLDIGTTSVGFAVIDHDSELATGKIHRLGVRIFPEARDPKGVPLNQERRQACLRRHRLRSRRARQLLLRHHLYAAGPPSRHTYLDAAVLARVEARIEQLAALGPHHQTADPDTYRTRIVNAVLQDEYGWREWFDGEGRADEDRYAVTGAPRRVSYKTDFRPLHPSGNHRERQPMKRWNRFGYKSDCAALARHFEKRGDTVRASGKHELNVRKPTMSRAVYARKHGIGRHPPGKPWRIGFDRDRSEWLYFGTLAEVIEWIERY